MAAGLTPDQISESRDKLNSLYKREKMRRDAAEARNELESYVLIMKNSIEDRADVKAVGVDMRIASLNNKYLYCKVFDFSRIQLPLFLVRNTIH